jgi:hypothetical protein
MYVDCGQSMALSSPLFSVLRALSPVMQQQLANASIVHSKVKGGGMILWTNIRFSWL